MSTFIISPRISEQTYQMANNSNVYVFNVPLNASKQQIAKAVNEQYEVDPTAIRTSVLKGKTKTSVQRGRQAVNGRRIDVKKAYVTLKDGQSIPIFEDVE